MTAPKKTLLRTRLAELVALKVEPVLCRALGKTKRELLTMNKFMTVRILVSATILMLSTQAAFAGDSDRRIFMFVGEPNAAAWKFLVDNPADREQEIKAGMEAIGGKVLSYYFGLGDGKNYITVELPDNNEIIQAVYVMRLPSGLLNSYELVELMPSAQMSEALKRSKKLIELEKELGSNVQ